LGRREPHTTCRHGGMPSGRDRGRQSCRSAASRDEHTSSKCTNPEVHTTPPTSQRRTHHIPRISCERWTPQHGGL
jgi:hypothetical protein